MESQMNTTLSCLTIRTPDPITINQYDINDIGQTKMSHS